MAQATFSVRMDDDLKKNFDALCQEFGMNATVAFNIFARAVVSQRRIPFEIQASTVELTKVAGKEAFYALRQSAKERGLQSMSLDDINEEIRQTRIKEGI